MNQKQIRNIPASIRSKLLQLSKQRGEDFNYLLVRYASDRLLYRLSQSPYQKQFILKEATLFRVWNGEPHRATKDLDLLSFGPNDISSLEEVFKEICRQEYEPDGISFESETVKGEKIREDQEYEGVRITLQAKLDSAKISIQVDIGFGDAVTPSPEEALLPSILDLPAPVLQIYRRETVVAEKFQAMVALGISNSCQQCFVIGLYCSIGQGFSSIKRHNSSYFVGCAGDAINSLVSEISTKRVRHTRKLYIEQRQGLLLTKHA